MRGKKRLLYLPECCVNTGEHQMYDKGEREVSCCYEVGKKREDTVVKRREIIQ